MLGEGVSFRILAAVVTAPLLSFLIGISSYRLLQDTLISRQPADQGVARAGGRRQEVATCCGGGVCLMDEEEGGRGEAGDWLERIFSGWSFLLSANATIFFNSCHEENK